jgi:DNA polymerase
MLVGEGPGFNEDKLGRPFVGAAGRLLDQVLLPQAGLARQDVYITNVVKHRPPNNRDPLPDELAACLPYLERQIALIRPQVIVTLGRFSLGTFFPGDMISRVHGQVRTKDGRHFFHMYHPAAALHREQLRQTLEDDMRTLGEFLKNNPSSATEAAEDDSSEAAGDEQNDEGTSPTQLSFF